MISVTFKKSNLYFTNVIIASTCNRCSNICWTDELGPTAQGYAWLSFSCFVQYEKSVFSSLKEIGKILAACQESYNFFIKA